ncbi:hypothetical protein FHW84_001838 [Dyella sp. SG562]|uniref:hypothetical protein n=1 Tax=Dyella sp. SG562 TaxID=2587017 RepID=UPI0014208ADA|nr:hypothetical protein [Dyella sp. SG562]NII73269.1 hypothetical protein [Dyella sp. SG562]
MRIIVLALALVSIAAIAQEQVDPQVAENRALAAKDAQYDKDHAASIAADKAYYAKRAAEEQARFNKLTPEQKHDYICANDRQTMEMHRNSQDFTAWYDKWVQDGCR